MIIICIHYFHKWKLKNQQTSLITYKKQFANACKHYRLPFLCFHTLHTYLWYCTCMYVNAYVWTQYVNWSKDKLTTNKFHKHHPWSKARTSIFLHTYLHTYKNIRNISNMHCNYVYESSKWSFIFTQ